MSGLYHRIAKIYDILDFPSEYFYYKQMRKKWIGTLNNERILEVGVGTGKNLIYYNASNQVAAIDREEKMLQQARKRIKRGINAQVDLILVDGFTWQIPRDFTTVVATFVCCTMKDPSPLLEEIQNHLIDGGKLILFEYTRSTRRWLRVVNWFMNPLTKLLFGVDFKRKPTREFIDDSWEVESITPIVDDWIEVIELRKLSIR